MKCETCGTESNKLYWWRQYPTVYLCVNCWHHIDKFESHLFRISLARELKKVRKTLGGRREAIRWMQELKGTGVPINLKRRQQ